MKRMDRYNDNNNYRLRRSEKNKELYQSLSNNPKYANITDVTNANAFEIRDNKEITYNTREDYQKMKKYQNIDMVPRSKKELEDVNYLTKNQEKKIYDINSVLEDARKNRQEKDTLEEKRKLKNTSYNILANLNSEELNKYREEKKNKIERKPNEELRELIDTITSKTLAGEIDKATSVDLLSDLMATNILDKAPSPAEITESIPIDENGNEKKPDDVLDQEQLKELEKISEEEPEEVNSVKEADSDFYTRSMDLSDKDFDLSDEFKEKKLPVFVKILLFLIIVGVIAVAAYFIYQRIY